MPEITGSPIGGENPPHERAWRAAVAAAAATVGGSRPVSAATLHFRLEPHRKVDLDNLIRPALAGFRDAGVFTRGFPELHAVLASKEPHQEPSMTFTLEGHERIRRTLAPGPPLLVAAGTVLPRDGDRDSKLSWRDQVRRSWSGEPTSEPVWVDFAARTTGSLVAILKPVIDGLEPLLGRDPGGRLEFCPNDARVAWLRIAGEPNLPCALVLAAGHVERR